MHPAEFQKKWIGVELKERSAAQEHFIDLCRVLGEKTPAEADGKGEFYMFERGARKTTGGDGWADVWYRGKFAWEYKGKRANLKAAYDQLQLYRESLENPPLLIVSDLNIIEIHTNFTGTVKEVHTIDLPSFADPGNIDKLRRVFRSPESFRPTVTVERVTKEAAERFSEIAKGMRSRGVSSREAAHFLVQLLFCLFAEDVGLLPNTVFSRMVHALRRRPDQFPRQAEELLAAMRDGGIAGYEEIPYFNGGLFERIAVAELTAEELTILARATELDWSAIEPSIFGTLFERSLDPATRAALGAQYTGRDDIERVVKPVVMEPLRRKWEDVRAEADELKRRWDEAVAEMGDTSKRLQDRRRRVSDRRRAFENKLAEFRSDLQGVRVLDPACGSGNFLYVALAELLNLDKEAMLYGFDNGLPLGFPAVGPRQVLGMEINEYARELAQVAIWIGYLQWMIQNGFTGLREPVLEPLETIQLGDSLLTERGGMVSETVWPEADYIIGNPPFLGGNKVRQELGDEYVESLFRVYRGRLAQRVDLACYFFEKARAQVDSGEAKRVGLLATNSIRGGVNRRVLERIKESGDIFMAWADEPWVLDGAAVRISIVGFDDGTEDFRCLDGVPVSSINADLTATVDLSVARRLPENADIAFEGDKKAGKFEVPNQVGQAWLALPTNPNGRPNSDVVRPWVNGKDIAGRPQHRWIVDFGVDMTEREASLYEAPFKHVVDAVKPDRLKNNDAGTRRFWWLHQRPRPQMRAAVAGKRRFIVTIRHSKHRLFVWTDPRTVPDSALVVIARDDDYFFGVLHSRAHEVWSLRMGTSLEDRPRYTPTTTFETFPLPWAPGCEPQDDPRVQMISEGAQRLNDLRENWLNPEGATEAQLRKRTLTDLYNERPQWLENAHGDLDRAVWAAYGWEDDEPACVDEDTILARLLALNLERAG